MEVEHYVFFARRIKQAYFAYSIVEKRPLNKIAAALVSRVGVQEICCMFSSDERTLGAKCIHLWFNEAPDPATSASDESR
jgi:hypothetical protein